MEISLSLSPNSIPRTSPTQSISSHNSIFFNNGTKSLLLKKKKNPNTNCLILSRNTSGRGFNCRCLFGLGVPELAVIAGVAVLLFGPNKLPDVGRSLGKTIKGFQQAAKEFETELKQEPQPEPVREEPPPAEKPTTTIEEKKQDTKIAREDKSS